MPPRETNINTPLTVNYDTFGTIATTTANEWIADPLSNDYGYVTTARTVRPNGFIFETNGPFDETSRRIRFELDHILDNYFRKIYKVISEHVVMDISENEFMKLIKENENE